MQAGGSALERSLDRLHPIWLLAAVFLVVFAIHAASPVTTSTDSAWTFHLAASILREHNINLDEYRSLMDLPLDYRLRSINGHIYYYYPVATPLLVTPVVWIVNKLYPISHPTDFYDYLATHAPDERTARLEKVVAAGFVALSAVVMYMIARRFLGVVGSTAITFVFAFSTSMWSTASRALWQHGPSVLFLALALYLTLSAADKPAGAYLVGLILGFAYVIRPTNSLSVAFFGLYFLLNHRSRFVLYSLGATTILIPYVAQNLSTYGNIFPPYSYQLFERLGTPADIAQGLAGTLVSPGRGLFVFTPVFLFALYGCYLAVVARARVFSTLDPYLLGVVATHWITTSLFEDWGGAWSIGPRYLVDTIPFLVYFLIPLFELNRLAKPGLKIAFSGAILVSTLIQLHCATSIYPFMWNGKPQALVDAPDRKWDWGDLQFLRGFCPGNPLEGRAPACWFERVN